jgi:hypothetical protein
MHARNQGVTMIFIHALTENTTMLGIARKAGATVVARRQREPRRYLSLSPANLDTACQRIGRAAVRRGRLPGQVPEQAACTDLICPSQSGREGPYGGAFRAGLSARPTRARGCLASTGRCRIVLGTVSAILAIPDQPPHVLHFPAVSDPHPARPADREDKRTFLQKAGRIHPSRTGFAEELIEALVEAEDNKVIIGAESRACSKA